MILQKSFKVYPPPFKDPSGTLITPEPISGDTLEVNFNHFPKAKAITASIKNLSLSIPLYIGFYYDQLFGEWDDTMLLKKLNQLLGDDPSAFLQKLYPPTLESDPNGPGSILHNMLSFLGIKTSANCSCKNHAILMNQRGNDWCEHNIPIIISWMKKEAEKRKLPFVETMAKMMIHRAINRSRKLKAKNDRSTNNNN